MNTLEKSRLKRITKHINQLQKAHIETKHLSNYKNFLYNAFINEYHDELKPNVNEVLWNALFEHNSSGKLLEDVIPLIQQKLVDLRFSVSPKDRPSFIRHTYFTSENQDRNFMYDALILSRQPEILACFIFKGMIDHGIPFATNLQIWERQYKDSKRRFNGLIEEDVLMYDFQQMAEKLKLLVSRGEL